MRELSLLFGATARAASVTLAAFFCGMAVGGGFWGRRAPTLPRPLLAYGLMELGVAVAAAGCLLVMPLYRSLYPFLFQVWEHQPEWLLCVKFVLSFVALFPAAFLMGGTLPVVSRIKVGQGGTEASLFYALNTLGATGGALAAGFWLPGLLGFRHAYLLAMTVSAAVGIIACLAGRSPDSPASSPAPAPVGRVAEGYALLSGFVVVALEVLWTRMFAQVLQNSVYTFALVLTACVLGLALGAFIARSLTRSGWRHVTCLYVVLVVCAVAIATTPHVFLLATEGLRYAGQGLGWGPYLLHVSGLIGFVVGPALIALGVPFPLLFALAGRGRDPEAPQLGRLLWINALGGASGALAAGFFLLDWLGLWASIRLLAMVYLVAALASEYFSAPVASGWRALALSAVLMLVSVLDTARLPVVRVDPLQEDESLLDVWEDGAAVVAVVRHGDHLKIKQDNHYTLGGSGSAGAEALQGSLPVLLHAKAEAVFALGLGTGITAGATLRHPILRLEVAELLPAAVEAARRYFSPFDSGLFDDARTTVVQEDGRHYLAAAGSRYDVIVGDLFVPWQAGAGSLYAREHFLNVKERLNAGGLFMQWLPAYQLSRDEFGSIARTLLSVFPQVTLWRGDFSPRTPVLGLLAQAVDAPLSQQARLFTGAPDAVGQGGARLLMHYVGRLERADFLGYPVNSDDRPVIEFRAPVTQRRQKLGQAQWLTGPALIELLTEVRQHAADSGDAYLHDMPERLRRLADAGLCRHSAEVEKHEGYLLAAEQHRICAEEILRQADDTAP